MDVQLSEGDASVVAVSSRFMALNWKTSGAGSVAIIPLRATGKRTETTFAQVCRSCASVCCRRLTSESAGPLEQRDRFDVFALL